MKVGSVKCIGVLGMNKIKSDQNCPSRLRTVKAVVKYQYSTRSPLYHSIISQKQLYWCDENKLKLNKIKCQ